METVNDVPSGPKSPLTDDERKTKRERDSLKFLAHVAHQIEASTNERYTESLGQALGEIDWKWRTWEPLLKNAQAAAESIPVVSPMAETRFQIAALRPVINSITITTSAITRIRWIRLPAT